MGGYAEGIDIHSIKPTLWAGKDFVFLKASGGFNYSDPKYRQRSSQAKEAGLIVGGYHFFRTEDGAHNQARHFLRQIEDTPYDVLWVDFERWVRQSDGKNLNPRTGKDAENLRVWLQIVREAVSVPVGVYTNWASWEYFVGAKPWNAHGVPLWVANWDVDEPLVPRPWKELGWDVWQYTVAPIQGEAIDHNRYKGTPDQMRAWLRISPLERKEGEPVYFEEIAVSLKDVAIRIEQIANTLVLATSGGEAIGQLPGDVGPGPDVEEEAVEMEVVARSEDVGKTRIRLHEIKSYNDAGYPIFIPNRRRIIYNNGASFVVKKTGVQGDGSQILYYEIMQSHTKPSSVGMYVREDRFAKVRDV
ncbi:MAG: hypothetical protein DWQ07_23275 [Chloroflexi bacterium]|nr:MAG: hypothetical protein DWQ07_23275 [Chloroflexota bacterium]MBL1194072.1 hypothetical protein [Chloroflexota bacterium]NOH11366.1 glycoside hydrolase family 25 protein [Chloroflexota bacterium]